ncbi:hypothetical protein ACIHEI_12370 [Kitasatospora sp. NPDC051984]|uniref:hypothetical protein n=1 Tax=Kitasatospora sp. NPDC051984 TaxID=3364059 RepID=UPI0037C861F8
MQARSHPHPACPTNTIATPTATTSNTRPATVRPAGRGPSRHTATPNGTSATHNPTAATTDPTVVPFNTPRGIAAPAANATARTGPNTPARQAPHASNTHPPMIAAFNALNTWNAPYDPATSAVASPAPRCATSWNAKWSTPAWNARAHNPRTANVPPHQASSGLRWATRPASSATPGSSSVHPADTNP